MSAPALIVRFELEREPEIVVDALDDAELDAHPSLLQAIARLFATIERERAV